MATWLTNARAEPKHVREHGLLLGGIAGFTEHRPPGKPNMDPAGRPESLHPCCEVGHGDRRNPPGLDLARDQTPGLVADGSDGDDEGEADLVLGEEGGDGGGGLASDLVGARLIADEARNARGQSAHGPLAHEHP